MGKHSMGTADRQWGGPELVEDAEAAVEAATTSLPAVDEADARAEAD